MDRDTFGELMVQHLPAARRLAIRLAGRSDAADDLLQTALCRAAGAWKSYRGGSEFSTWLYRIIVNAFRDGLRKRNLATTKNEVAVEVDPSRRLAEEELEQLIGRAVSTLPPRQQEVLVLITYQELSAEQAGEVLGITSQNVRVHLFEARKKLKAILADYL